MTRRTLESVILAWARVEFAVEGTPMPRGSHTAVVRGGRAVLLDARREPARKAYAAWKDAVTEAARTAMGDDALLDGALALHVTFWLRPPKNETRAERLRKYHAKKPDASKLLRAIEDPMSGVVYVDDARIVLVRAEKLYARDRAPGAHVVVTTLPDGD